MAKQADVVPVYRQLLSDHLTPVTAFENVVAWTSDEGVCSALPA